MDSDSEEETYSTSEDTEDDEPRPPSRLSSVSQHSGPDFSAISSEDDDVGNVAGQQTQPCLWTQPSQPLRRVVHIFIGAPNGKSREAGHVTNKSTPLSVLLLFFADIITLLVVETNRYYQQFLDNSDEGLPPQREVTESEAFGDDAMSITRMKEWYNRFKDLFIHSL
jgi:hypothetical protein